MALRNMIGYLFLSFCFVTSIFAAYCELVSTRQLSGSVGVMESPGWPYDYPDNALYCWRIYVPLFHVVKLTIPSTNMEPCVSCGCDSVQVFDGRSEAYTSLGKFCSEGRVLFSSGQYAFVKFKSDSARNGAAFRMTYTAVRGDSVPDNNDYGNNDNRNNKGKDENEGLGLKVGGSVGGVCGMIFLCVLYWIFCTE